MASKKPLTIWDLPTEIQREILSYLRYVELQKRRGVSRSWCAITDTINPDFLDSQSSRVRQYEQEQINEIEELFAAGSLGGIPLKLAVSSKDICYPYDASFFERKSEFTIKV